MGLMPAPGVADHVLERALGCPAERRTHLRVRRDQPWRVAGAARLLTRLERPAGDRACRLDDFTHGVAGSAAEVVDLVRAGHRLIEGEKMRTAQVLDVD